MRVLVTGATSMLGSGVVELLRCRGDVVTVLQRGASGLDVEEIRGDICSGDDVRRAVDGQEAVVHLAAKVDVTGALGDFERVNVGGTSTVVAESRRAGVGRFVYVSSPSVAHGGSAIVGATAETADPSGTRGHYATTKASAELLALDASGDSMPVVAIRPHLVWGPGDTQLVGRIVDRASTGRLALVGSGAALIDTTYVDNAASALVAAIDAAPRLGGQSFVVSNGEPRTVAELVGRILSAAGLGSPTKSVPSKVAFAGGLVVERVWERSARDGDPPMTSFLAEQLSTAHWFDQRQTRSALDWAPSVDLATGFARLAAWFGATG